MAEHLSALELDVMVTGGTLSAERSAHLAGCGDCKQKIDAERAAADAVKMQPQFGATLAKLTAAQPAPRAKVIPLQRRAPVIFTLALAAAAVIVLIINPPKDDETRLKGNASVELLSEANQAVRAAHVGDQLQLALGAAGRPYAMVLGVDERGQIDLLWPQTGHRSGPAPKGARTVVTRFEVTQGSITLVGLFSEQPLDIQDASRTLTGALKEGKVPQPLELPGVATAVAHLEVAK
jgi:hypothetical protein